jgi:hypothetical protein
MINDCALTGVSAFGSKRFWPADIHSTCDLGSKCDSVASFGHDCLHPKPGHSAGPMKKGLDLMDRITEAIRHRLFCVWGA